MFYNSFSSIFTTLNNLRKNKRQYSTVTKINIVLLEKFQLNSTFPF